VSAMCDTADVFGLSAVGRGEMDRCMADMAAVSHMADTSDIVDVAAASDKAAVSCIPDMADMSNVDDRADVAAPSNTAATSDIGADGRTCQRGPKRLWQSDSLNPPILMSDTAATSAMADFTHAAAMADTSAKSVYA